MTDTRYLPARVLQGFGLVLLAACFIYWAATKEQSELFVAAALSLITAGSIQGLRVSTQLMREPLPPAPTIEDPGPQGPPAP